MSYQDEANWYDAQKSTPSSRWREKHLPKQRLVPAAQLQLNELDTYWPITLRARAWIGAMLAWLEHPYVGERECFGEALEELNRLRKEVA